MKKIIFFTLCVLSQMVSLQAFDIEARIAYFLPQDTRMRDIYGKNGLPEYEIEVSAPFQSCCDCSCDWDMWANLSYYDGSGHSSCLRNSTWARNWTLTAGLKRYFDVCMCFRPYLGLGVGLVNAQFKDRSPFVSRHVNKWGTAILVKSGIKYDVTCNIFLDLFMDYSYNWIMNKGCCHSKRNLTTGGLKLGLGLGYQF